MWVTKLLISPVKKRIFCPKTTKFGPKLACLVNLGQARQAYSVPCWWVGWLLWRAGCISQDTYLLYDNDKDCNDNDNDGNNANHEKSSHPRLAARYRISNRRGMVQASPSFQVLYSAPFLKSHFFSSQTMSLLSVEGSVL